jgi:hypothetical protein
LRRLGRPADVGNACMFLALSMAEWITAFKDWSRDHNIAAGDIVQIKVGLVDGYHANDDSFGFRRKTGYRKNVDG